MSRPRIDARSAVTAAVAAILIGGALASCSDAGQYLDRRDTIVLSGGDAVAGNTVAQMVDPWPASSGDKNIAFNGQKMQSADERYRNGKVIQPVDPETLTSTNQPGQTISTTVNNGSAATTPGQ